MSDNAALVAKARDALVEYRRSQAEAKAAEDAEEARLAAEEAAQLKKLLHERLGVVDVTPQTSSLVVPELELEFVVKPSGLVANWTQDTEIYQNWHIVSAQDVGYLLDAIEQHKKWREELDAANQAREAASAPAYRMVFLNPRDGLFDVVEWDESNYELEDVDLNELARAGWRVKATFTDGPHERYSHALLLERAPYYEQEL